jgi:Fe-S cluster biosynthesis and repair protein YggX
MISLIERIEQIRNNNNFSTLAFIRLLTDIKPEAAKEAWDKIQQKDTEVINLFRKAVMNKDIELIDQNRKSKRRKQ